MEDEITVSEDTPVISEESSDGNTTINIYMPDGSTSSEISEQEGAQAASVENVENLQASTTADLDARSSDRSGMAAVVETIFGDYFPRTQTVTTTAEDGSVTTTTQLVPGVAGMDMVWIAGVISFLVVLSGFISILRVVIRHD